MTTESSPQLARALACETQRVLEQGLGKIEHCLAQLSEEQVWWRPAPDLNSIGNLLLHLRGNVRQWIVCGVGGEPDDRQRAREFRERGPIPARELLEKLKETVAQAGEAMAACRSTDWLQTRRIQGFEVTTLEGVLNSVSHFQGHVQEIILLTRWQCGAEYQFHWQPTTPEEGAPESPVSE